MARQPYLSGWETPVSRLTGDDGRLRALRLRTGCCQPSHTTLCHRGCADASLLPVPVAPSIPVAPCTLCSFLQPFPAMLAGVATGRAATHTLRIPAGMQCQNLKPGAAPFPFDGQWGRYHSPFMEGIRMQTWSNPGKSPLGAAGEAAASGRSAGLFPERTRV